MEQDYPRFYKLQEFNCVEICVYLSNNSWIGSFIGIKCGDKIGIFNLEPFYDGSTVQARGIASALTSFILKDEDKLTLRAERYISEEFKDRINHEIKKRESIKESENI